MAVVTSIKIWAKEWINSKCSSCNNKIWEVKTKEVSYKNNSTIKWCLAHKSISKSKVVLEVVLINLRCQTKWVLLVAWVWWVQCKDKICHLTCKIWRVWELVLLMEFNKINSPREITQICLLCMQETCLIKHLILISWNSLILKDIKSQVQKWCLTKNQRDQKDLVISISILKKKLIDAWLKWTMLLLMIDVLCSTERKTTPVDLIVRLMF